jgi:hypothetical protein
MNHFKCCAGSAPERFRRGFRSALPGLQANLHERRAKAPNGVRLAHEFESSTIGLSPPLG